MSIVSRPTQTTDLGGGSIDSVARGCTHTPPKPVTPWRARSATSGTVSVVGAGKMGTPLAAQFASHGWNVIAVDIDPMVVQTINDGRTHVLDEPLVPELISSARRAGRLRATTDGSKAASQSDVVVLIVPVMLDAVGRPNRSAMDAAVEAIGPTLGAGSLVVFETTLPVGDTRQRYAVRLSELSGLGLEDGDNGLYVAFSPERLYSGSAISNLATYPKLVGGVTAASTERAAAFYEAVLDTEIVAMSSAEAAELSKLADTTYRDVNIAFANELAAFADQVGVDVLEVIAAANSQPYSHIHQPGIGVGGHCIPVYPRFLLDRQPGLELVATSRRLNDGQIDVAVALVQDAIGELEEVGVLVLGLTYRHGVNELAYSRGMALAGLLASHGADVRAFDPLLTYEEIEGHGISPWIWGTTDPSIEVVITQTADPMFADLDWSWLPSARLLVDGRNALRGATRPNNVRRVGFGTSLESGRE